MLVIKPDYFPFGDPHNVRRGYGGDFFTPSEIPLLPYMCMLRIDLLGHNSMVYDGSTLDVFTSKKYIERRGFNSQLEMH